MKWKNFFKYLILSLLLFAGGCRLGPKYTPPEVEVPDEWKRELQECAEEANSCPTLWWEIFDDETLNSLEQQAIENSPNLFVALDKVAQARAIAGVDRAALYPQINLEPTYLNAGLLFKTLMPPGAVPSTVATKKASRIHAVEYILPLVMSYEVDLWGKLHNQYDSAVMDAQTKEEDFSNALLTLTSDVASSYFQIRALDAQISVIQMNLEWIRKNVDLVQTRFKKGLVNYQDVVTAESELATTEASLYEIRRQRALQENVLAVLIGKPASNFSQEYAPLLGEPPCIPPSLPSEVMLQRPDIASAERHMASEHALIGAAYASFFPSLKLTGALGSTSPFLKNFLTWESRLWLMAVEAAQVVFDAGRNRSNLNLAYSNFNESLHEYQNTVLTAFREVEDALANLEFQRLEYQSYQQAAGFAETRLNLSDHRYKQGLNTYLDVIDSERTVLQAEINVVIALGQRYLATIQLIKALGGTW